MYRSLMVPLDGSPESEQAVPIARRVALESHAALHFVHVSIPYQLIEVDRLPTVDTDLYALSREQKRSYLQRLAQPLIDNDRLTVTVDVVEGSVVPSLLEHANSIHVDLIVMTTHGRSGWERAWLGSVADALIRLSSVPVVLVRMSESPAQATTGAFRRILIPTDGSAEAEEVLAPAVTLDPHKQADYLLVHVVESSLLSDMDHVMRSLNQREVPVQRLHEAEVYLTGVAERLHVSDPQVQTVVLADRHPAHAILGYAREYAVDLIALATHARHGMSRMLLGSVADKVIRGADVPVLVYHRG